MKKNVILVPTDFTKVADNALNNAIDMAKIIHGEVILLHVVAKKDEISKAKTILDELVKNTVNEYKVPTTGIVKEGNIFDDIGEVAKEVNAKFIVMGTHGVKGIQHLVGSYAMKVITNSQVPFIVVQERKLTHGFKNIVLPLDLSKETKQKVGFASAVAKYFNSKIHIITPKETDEFFIRKVNNNLLFAKKFFKEHFIDFTTHEAKSKGGGYVKEMIQFSVSINADLICIMNLGGAGFTNLFGGNTEQQIITNEAQIPVMCINPTQVSIESGVYLP